MGTLRQQKVANLIKRELSEIFLLHGSAYLPGKMITVTITRISPDLSFAKSYLSIFPTEDLEKDIDTLRAHVKEIRFELGKRIRHQLRVVPELAFFGDDSIDYAEEIDELLK